MWHLRKAFLLPCWLTWLQVIDCRHVCPWLVAIMMRWILMCYSKGAPCSIEGTWCLTYASTKGVSMKSYSVGSFLARFFYLSSSCRLADMQSKCNSLTSSSLSCENVSAEVIGRVGMLPFWAAILALEYKQNPAQQVIREWLCECIKPCKFHHPYHSIRHLLVPYAGSACTWYHCMHQYISSQIDIWSKKGQWLPAMASTQPTVIFSVNWLLSPAIALSVFLIIPWYSQQWLFMCLSNWSSSLLQSKWGG